MKIRISIFIAALFLLFFILWQIKKSQDFTSLRETKKELSEMQIQKDSVFQMADEIAEYTKYLRIANDSLKKQDRLKIVEKEIVIRDTVEIFEENIMSAMKVVDEGEVENLRQELQMYKFRIYGLYTERDSLLLKLENLQKELDSLKIKK